MRVVVQKVNKSSVTVDKKLVNEIGRGLCILVGFTEGDTEEDINYMVNKVTNLRVFEDENDVMNLSVKDVKGSILSKGNRPSYVKALPGDKAKPLYELFNKKLNEIVPTYDGIFGADMKVLIENDGPTTILIESKK